MVKIIFESPDGSRREVSAAPGAVVMRLALSHGIDGIVAECGGSAACGTCHVHVIEGPAELLPAKTIQEDQMLDCTAEPRQADSRLSCQLILPETDRTFVFRLAERQL